MDERERIQRLRKIKVIVTEIFMFISVIFLVSFLTLIVTGYSFNLNNITEGEGELIERTGLLQISSVPTGATIKIDGGTPLLLRTNASKTVSAGSHQVELYKEGYDGWSKEVNVKEGLMYRINYPRLFLKERESEKVLTLEGITYSAVTPKKDKMLIVQSGKMYILNLNENKPVLRSLDFELIKKFETIKVKEWSGNGEKVLVEVNGELFVLDIRNTSGSVKLNSISSEGMERVKFETTVGDRLVALFKNGTLREIDLRTKKVGEKLVGGVISFDNNEENVVFVKEEKVGEIVKYSLQTYVVGGSESYKLSEIEDKNAVIKTMNYFEEKMIAVGENEKLRIYRFDEWPDGEIVEEVAAEENVGFGIKNIEKKGKGMVFDVLGEGGQEVVYNVEAEEITKIENRGEKVGWIDEFLRYYIENEDLFVRDFDGLNERELIVRNKNEAGETSVAEQQRGILNQKDAEINSGQIIVISGNNRYLYYFMGDTLVREKIN